MEKRKKNKRRQQREDEEDTLSTLNQLLRKEDDEESESDTSVAKKQKATPTGKSKQFLSSYNEKDLAYLVGLVEKQGRQLNQILAAVEGSRDAVIERSGTSFSKVLKVIRNPAASDWWKAKVFEALNELVKTRKYPKENEIRKAIEDCIDFEELDITYEKFLKTTYSAIIKHLRDKRGRIATDARKQFEKQENGGKEIPLAERKEKVEARLKNREELEVFVRKVVKRKPTKSDCAFVALVMNYYSQNKNLKDFGKDLEEPEENESDKEEDFDLTSIAEGDM